MNTEFDVMVAGHVCFDLIPRFPGTDVHGRKELLRPGAVIEVAECAMSTGGPVSNTGLAMKVLGNRVCFSARVGDDDFGRLTLENLRRAGSSEGIHVVAGAGSSYTIVIAMPGIDRFFFHNPATNDAYGVEDLDPELVGRCRLLHFGYPPLMRGMFLDEGAELVQIMKLAKEAGATTSCDMALPDPTSEAGRAPWHRILEKVLPYVDLFLPSLEEALYMVDRDGFLDMKRKHENADLIHVLNADQYSQIADQLLDMGTSVAALKAGARGWFLKTRSGETFDRLGRARPGDPAAWAGRELLCPALKEDNIVAATGSGDSSIAGFLTAFLKGRSPEQCLRASSCLGWQNLQVLDAVSGIKSWEETEAILARHPAVEEIPDVPPAWRWEDEQGIWFGPSDRG